MNYKNYKTTNHKRRQYLDFLNKAKKIETFRNKAFMGYKKLDLRKHIKTDFDMLVYYSLARLMFEDIKYFYSENLKINLFVFLPFSRENLRIDKLIKELEKSFIDYFKFSEKETKEMQFFLTEMYEDYFSFDDKWLIDASRGWDENSPFFYFYDLDKMCFKGITFHQYKPFVKSFFKKYPDILKRLHNGNV